MRYNNHFGFQQLRHSPRSMRRTPGWLTLILVTVGLVVSGVSTSPVNAQNVADAINEDNDAPVFIPVTPTTVNADKHETVSFTLNAFDQDIPAQILTYSALNLPAGATLNPTTGAFSWTPSQAQGGEHYFVKFKVTDNGNPQRAAAQAVRITVVTANLLKNSGFQMAGKTAKQAENWKGSRLLSSDKRVCKPALPAAETTEAACVFQFSATPAQATNRKLRQQIDPAAFTSGDTLQFSGTFRAEALTNGARVQLVAKLDDGTTRRATVKLSTGGDTSLATVHSFEQTLALTATPVKLWLEISTGVSRGKLFLDDQRVIILPTSLVLETADAPSLISLPTAPDLRGNN